VVRLAVVEVEPAEHQALLFGVQRVQLRGGAVHHRVAFDEPGHRAAGCAVVTLAGECVRLLPHVIQPFVDPVDDLLFGGDLLRPDVGHSAPRYGVSWVPDENKRRSAPRNQHPGRFARG
jgi:hypothetical protein